MKPVYLGCCAMIVAFGFAFFIMGLVPLPLPWYHLLDRQWVFELRPHELAMDFYGRTLYATVFSGLAYAIGHWAGRKLPAEIHRDQAWLWLAYGLGFTVLAMCLIGYQIWPRPASPVPIPSWYVPK